MDFSTLTAEWGIDFSEVDPDPQIEGSPERTLARSVFRDTKGRRWILEQIGEANLTRKQEIAEQLNMLASSGLQRIHPYRRTCSNSFFQTLENPSGAGSACWMLRSFVEGIPLNRETYLNDPWRIDEMSGFLLQLRENSATHPGLRPPLQGRGVPKIPSTGGVPERRGGFFSIAAYAESRMKAWRTRYSKLAEKFEGSFVKLEQSFFPLHDQLPLAFCHGDFHPLNMIWGPDSIRSVIDWEFCGIKPELYDVALLIGCLGFENPDNLIREPVIRLVQTLRTAGYGAQESWENILELAATIRFGWMSEWIRRSDREAREMEAVYIDILVDQKEYILRHWQA